MAIAAMIGLGMHRQFLYLSIKGEGCRSTSDLKFGLCITRSISMPVTVNPYAYTVNLYPIPPPQASNGAGYSGSKNKNKNRIKISSSKNQNR